MIAKGSFFEEYVGRRDELELLVDLRKKAARESASSCVTNAGDAGIGKSRLIREFLKASERERGAAVVARCDTIVPTPYAAVGLVLDAALATARGFAPLESARAAFASLAAPGSTLDLEREGELYAAVMSALERFAARRGHLVVVVEDAHACDLASLRLFDALVRRAERAPIVVVFAYRKPDDGDSGRAEALANVERHARYRIVLEPLPAPLLAAAIERVFPESAGGLAKTLVERSEGNPFFAEELASARRDRHDEAIPATLRAGLLARIEDLPSDALTVVRAAAVIGREFDFETLAAIVPQAERAVVETLRVAIARDVVRERDDGRFVFRHALLRDVLEDSLLRVEARRLHAKIATVLEHRERTPQLTFAIAWHRFRAGDPVIAIDANEAAADAAAAINAHADAAECYDRALSLAETGSQAYLRIARKAVESYATIGSFERYLALALPLIDHVERHGDTTSALDLMMSTITRAMVVEQTKTADSLIARARSLLAGGSDSDAIVRLETAVAEVLQISGRDAEALEALARAEPKVPSCAPLVAMRFFNTRSIVANTMKDFAGAIADKERALAICEAENFLRGRLVVSSGLCSMMIDLGHARSVIDRLRADAALARTTEYGHAKTLLTITLTIAHVVLGELSNAATVAHDALDSNIVSGSHRAELAAEAFLIASLTGDSLLAVRSAIDEHLERVVRNNDPWPMTNVLSTTAYALRFADPIRATALLKTLFRDGSFYLVGDRLAECVARLGDGAQIAFVRRSLEDARTIDDYPLAAATHDLFEAIVAAREHRTIEARTYARRAAERFEALAMPIAQATAYEIAGEIGRAVATYERIGALSAVQRLSEIHKAAVDADVSLTPREEQVCRLTVSGLTSREVANELGIGARTAETHLANAYRKLGLRTRADLSRHFNAS